MSLVLLWENPLKVMEPLALRARIIRRCVDPAPVPEIVIEESSTWGFFEDTEYSDPSLVEYDVSYVDKNGSEIVRVMPSDIRVAVRAADMAIVTYQGRDWMGLPDSGHPIEISDEINGGSLYMRFLTNPDGIARFPLKWDAHVLIRVNHELTALDVVVPHAPELTWRTLTCYGSRVDVDRRGWY